MKSRLHISAMLVLFLLLLAGCSDATKTDQSSSTQAASLSDQVAQALSGWPDVLRRSESEVSPGVVLVITPKDTDVAGEAETLAQAINLASGYQKSIWQANITGLSEVTVIVYQFDYHGSSSNPSSWDVVKAIVTKATGTTLDWKSGTPAQQFQQFDVHWVFGEGQEP